MRISRGFAATFILTLAAIPARAQIVFNNGAPSATAGDANPSLSQGVLYQSFTLSNTSNITNIEFWTNDEYQAATQPDYAGSYYWVIRSSVSNAPGSILAGGTTIVPTSITADGTANNLPSGPFTTTDWKTDLTVNFTLSAGTYFLGLHNGALSHVASDFFYWTQTATGDGKADFYSTLANGGAPYNTDQYNEAFNLSATSAGSITAVSPEPATMSLLALGLVGMATANRRRRRTK